MRRGGRPPKLAKRKNTAAWCHEVEYLYTFGPEVADIAASAGLIPDENQQWILDQTFGQLADGRPAAFEVDLIAPRQNIKTASIIMIELGWMFVTQESLIIHTAHELDATEEAFIDLRNRIEGTPQLAKHLDPSKGEKDHPGIYTGNGSWEIHLLGETRMKYKARRDNAGRALTADKLVLDEFFAVKPAMVGSLYPTLTTIPDAQVVTASSAGKLESKLLREHRTRGRAGSSPRQCYAEWGDPRAWQGCRSRTCDHALTAIGCALDDEKRWAEIMPAWGLRVFPETIRAMRQAMPPLEFAREFMVWHEDPKDLLHDSAIELTTWAGLGNPAAPAPNRAVLVIDVATDRSSAAIGVAGRGSTPGKTLVLVTTQPGVAWVVDAVKALTEKRNITEVALVPNSQAGTLIPALVQAGVKFTPLTTNDVGRSCGAFVEAVNAGTIEHVGQHELDQAIGNLLPRQARGLDLWDPRDHSVPITPAYAAAGAAMRWGLAAQRPAPSPVTLNEQEPTVIEYTNAGFDPATSGF